MSSQEELRSKLAQKGIISDSNNVKNHPSNNVSVIKPLSFDEIKADNPVPRKNILTPILPEQGLMFIYATTGLGKTFFTLNLMYSIAKGGQFLKYDAKEAKNVLYVDGEMAYKEIHSRLIKIDQQQGVLSNPNRFKLLTPDKILPYRMPKIDEIEGQNFYLKMIEDNGIDVVAFDNLSMLSSFVENKAEEWNSIQDFLLHLRSLGKSVIVVHHTGKDPLIFRGTSKMLACLDTAICMQPIKDEMLDDEFVDNQKFKIVYDKHRTFHGKDARPFEVTSNAFGWNWRSSELTEMDQIIECYIENMNQTAIAKQLNISQPKVSRLLKKAKFENKI